MNYIVKPATEAQKRVAWTNTCNEWGRGLSTSEYFSREERLESRPLTKENITVWILCVEDEPDSLDLKCSLDAITRPAYLKTARGIEEISVVTIASVFTPPAHRGNKFASMLIEKLHKELEANGNISASTLYSDVGQFYEKFGYSLFLPHHAKLPPHDNPSLPMKLIDESRVKEIADQDCESIKSELLNSSDDTLVVVPNSETYDWHFERSKFYAAKMRNTHPTVFGAEHEGEFVIWVYDYPNNRLTILRHRLVKHSDLLLSISQHFAHKEKLGTVYIWNLEPGLIKDTQLESQTQFQTRDMDSLPYIHSFKNHDNKLDWKLIQYYNWA